MRFGETFWLFYWWPVRVTLVVAWWLFSPKVLGGSRDLWIVIMLKKEYSFGGGDMWGGGDTQPLQDGKRKLWRGNGDGDVKTIQFHREAQHIGTSAWAGNIIISYHINYFSTSRDSNMNYVHDIIFSYVTASQQSTTNLVCLVYEYQ